MEEADVVRRFVLDFLREVGAEVTEADGVYTASFPAGFKRRFGRERRFTFEAERRKDQVELVEPGSPFLKLMLEDAQLWGGVGALATAEFPPGTRLYTFLIETYSSLRKRTQFVHARVEPGMAPRVETGFPPQLIAATPASDEAVDLEALRAGLADVAPAVEQAGRAIAEEAVRESHAEFARAMERVQQYFQGMRQETFFDEARIKKRLGEIQSKLYFTEDGLRELKLQQEAERLTHELHALKKKNTQATESIDKERSTHVDKVRRRHEPKLRIALVGATVTRGPAKPGTGAA